MLEASGPILRHELRQTVFFQLVARVPHLEFRRLVKDRDRAHVQRQFSAWDRFLALAFAQMTFRKSLRDTEVCLSNQRLAYHLGFRQRVTRSTLAGANEEKDWRVHSALAHRLMHRARLLYQDEPAVLDLEMLVYAVDSTFFDPSLASCPWADWNRIDAAVRHYTALDVRVRCRRSSS